MTAQAKKIDTVAFLEKLTEKHQFTVETRDGAQVVLNLTAPAAIDAAKATRLIRAISHSMDPIVEVPNLIRFACRSCIEGINSENVVAFLGQLPSMPPIPPVVRKCLSLLGAHEAFIDTIETEFNEQKFASLGGLSNK